MIHGITVSAYGGLVRDYEVEVLANNLANTDTTGFKRDRALFMLRPPAWAERIGGGERNAEPLGGMPGVPLLARTATDFAPGPIEKTDDPLHVALVGDGFFRVADVQGRMFLTRAGDFHRDENGFLVTADGRYRVQSNGGGDLAIATPPESVHIAEDGTILADGEAIGRLGVVDVPDMEGLSKVGRNLFLYEGAGEPVEAAARVMQGRLETSSSEPMTQLTAMIRAQRGYEMNLRMLRQQDDLLRQTVTDLGRI